MPHDATDLMQRAERVLVSATFGKVALSTVREYRRVAERIDGERLAAGSAWSGPTQEIESRNSIAVRRAAWCRRAHVEVAAAIRDIRERRVAVDVAVDRLAVWVPEAERTPSLPRGDITVLRGRRPTSARPIRSKRGGLKQLPEDWMGQLWHAAVGDQHRHLDALAVLLVTGCRPAEAAWGVGVRRVATGLEVGITGAKCREGAGQPWRRLTVSDDADGPAAHLLSLADAAGGVVEVHTTASPAALSMAVTRLGQDLGYQRRISAYDLRHQRCADARAAFGGDIERVSAWLGHSSTETARHYARPIGGGCRGARPLAVSTALPVQHRSHAAGPYAEAVCEL